MSHQIKRLRCTVSTAGSAGGNFPSTIDAQSSTWGPAATPAQPGPTVSRAAKAGALVRHRPNPLSRRKRYYAAASPTGFLTGKTAEADEIIRSGWPLPDPDTSMPLDDRKRARPTRAILIGWLQGSRPTRGSRRPGRLMTSPFQSHKPVVRRGAAFGIRSSSAEACSGAKKSRSL